jgi:branched-chain amino acid aminotransferase
MTGLQLYCLTGAGPLLLDPPAAALDLHSLFEGLPLGVYTVFRTHHHDRFLHLSHHLDRLEESMTRLGWFYELDRDLLRRAVQQLCSDHSAVDTRVRLDVLDARALAQGLPGREVIGLAPFIPPPDEWYRQGVSAATTRGLVRRDPHVKHSAFVARRRRLQQELGVFELLLVGEQDRVLEGASSNFYAFRGGRLLTAGQGVLEGVGRRVVLHVAGELELPVSLEPITVTELDTLEEAALSSSSRALVPIVSIDGRPVGDGRPGPLVRRLLEAYRAYVEKHVRPACW